MGFSIVFHFSASNANNSADFQESLNFLEYSCIFYCIWICTTALLEFFLWIALHVTDDAIAKLYVIQTHLGPWKTG